MALAFATEGRYICLEYDRYFVINLYVPNTGTDRLDARATGWDEPLRSHLRDLDAKKPVILLGDFNVSHTTLDLTHPEFMATSGRGRGVYAPQAGVRELEREGFGRLLREGGVGGFVDVFRDREPTNRQCSWRGSHSQNGNRARYAGMGMRLDYVSLCQSCVSVFLGRCAVSDTKHNVLHPCAPLVRSITSASCCSYGL